MQLKNEIGESPVAAAKRQTILPSEDRIRMTRLYEEVVTRLEEMAMITARTLKLNAGAGSTIRFNPVSPQSRVLELAAVEIVCTDAGSGCYDYSEGACFGIARNVELEVQN